MKKKKKKKTECNDLQISSNNMLFPIEHVTFWEIKSNVESIL